MLPMIDTVFGYLVAYFMVYAVVVGVWNVIITKITARKTEELASRDGGFDAVLGYTLAVSDSWMVRLNRNVIFMPLYNVIVLLLWPLYLPAMMVTSVYLAWKHLWKNVPAEPIEEAA